MMTSTRNAVASLALLVLYAFVAVAAQQETAPLAAPTVELSDAERKFDDIVLAFEEHLFDAGAFAVDVSSHWTYSAGDKKTQGTNLFHLAVQKGGKYRIEAGSTEKGKAQYVCVSDGSQITRLHLPAKFFSQHPVSVTHDDLQYDALTEQTLSGSGVELLIRPQIRADLIDQIASFRIVGDEKLEGIQTTHLQLPLKDGRLIDAWFTLGDKPLLLRMVTTQRFLISDQESVEIVTTSAFQWKVGGPLPTATFAVRIPPDARRVDDLLAALRDEDLRQLVGKQAPLLELKDLQGKTLSLADYRGKKVIVLMFWASWCAPSTHDMETLNAFVTEAEQNGAIVLAINLGEPAEQVRASVQEHGYRGTVLLDPETKSLDAFRFGELPMTILIGREGTVESFRSGSTAEARLQIRQETALLLEGKRVAPAGR
jgi:peroxiredoxin